MIKLLLSLILFMGTAQAALVDLGTPYANGGTVTASNLNGKFTAITAQVNGGLDNDNANATQGFRFFETKSSLPTNGNQGRVVFLTTNNTLNFDNGSTWQTTVTPTGTPSTGYIPYYNSGWTLLAPGAQFLPLVSNGASSLPSYQALNLASGVTSTLAIANGGTGQTTAQAAVDALLPSQSGNSGNFLTTNGSASSWANVSRLKLTSTTSFTGAATSGNISITNTKQYLVKVQLTDTSIVNIVWLRFNADSGSHYGYITTGTGATTSTGITSASKIIMVNMTCDYSTNRFPTVFTMNIYPQGTGGAKAINVDGTGSGIDTADTTFQAGTFQGVWTNSADATTFQILPSTGTFTGVVYLYEYS